MIRSGQVTVAAAGTAQQVSTDNSERVYRLRAHPSNTGIVSIGNDGADDVTVSNGFILDKADPPIFFRGNLSELYVDVVTNDDKLCWLLVIDS